ncbi:SRPBCC family protein [Dyadobacter sp. CY312]|uniref:SRPBCC family protein n=1 Tax=Dyadobacter sp. CY312 TaxID=2907303 RepID=UPI001F17883D|nr:SRPBCC family protein [Dyadobacter sp. CY312]MCE7042837.1 SRPBCC family protein [Dyadobacter sp. CY312]
MATSTVKFHRIIKAPVSKVFRAFSSADAMSFWLPPYGFLCRVHEIDFKVGGRYRMSFHNFTTEKSHSFGGEYLEIKPDELLKYSDKFEDPNLPGEMTTTVWLKEVICGTEMHIVQEGIPEQIPAEFCYLGWQESLEKLIKLVEPVINE